MKLFGARIRHAVIETHAQQEPPHEERSVGRTEGSTGVRVDSTLSVQKFYSEGSGCCCDCG